MVAILNAVDSRVKGCTSFAKSVEFMIHGRRKRKAKYIYIYIGKHGANVLTFL